MAQVVFTREFNDCLRKLNGGNAHGKRAVQKTRIAITEAGMEGQIASLNRTGHGEDRLPDVEKYDLGDGQRLVVQFVNPATQTRAFLYAGDHDDTERWLNNHRGYAWVRKASDGTLCFTRVAGTSKVVTPDPDLDSRPALRELPLLRELSVKHWASLRLPEGLQDYALGVTAETWEADASGIVAHIEQRSDLATAYLLCDLLDHAHKREWDALYRRIELACGEATIASPTDTATGMVAVGNSETFVTWEEASDLPWDGPWADWMLFLHPEQKKLARQDYTGPARLRGVSGSGKTCVLLHRAKYLAKKYGLPVRIITLTGSTQKLLDQLIGKLCGVEAQRIHVSTMGNLAQDLLRDLSPALRSFKVAPPEYIRELEEKAVERVRAHSAFTSSPLKSLLFRDLRYFVLNEIIYVRSRLLPTSYQQYLSREFKRRGRKIALTEPARQMFLEVVSWWDQQLAVSGYYDYEARIAAALLAATQTSNMGVYRCMLVDEVQDLSQNEVALLARMRAPDGSELGNCENGLFLVGDGAQTIYKKGFSLASVGIPVANRSFVLQKNYRNTKEVLKAAFRLISHYEFADVDEDNIQRPTEPHYANSHGERPCIIKCSSEYDQAEFVARHTLNLIEAGEVPGQICIIGFNKVIRDQMQAALKEIDVSSIELRDDVDFDSPAVKFSTVESAKGHEFSTVFVVGLNDDVIPSKGIGEDEIRREASRLYVAMTRARDALYLCYVADGRQRPSEFLAAVEPDCVEMEYSNGTTRTQVD